ncbi:MAG: ribonuclease HII [Alphaproteobacteria bacterium]|nr:ribonuclease HII [Alphaproteobacteria bacterium]
MVRINKVKQISFDIEKSFMQSDDDIILGVDEAGRGCLVGPVVAGCCWINQNKFPYEILCKIDDSKKISEKNREDIFQKLSTLPDDVFMFEYDAVSSNVIDEINILQASLLAMKNAYEKLLPRLKKLPKITLVDGNKAPLITPCHTVISGDAKSYSIAAASIVAKVMKDRLLNEIGKDFPEYEFDKNKGYGTKSHLEALEKYGITKYHRKTYAPVKKYIK